MSHFWAAIFFMRNKCINWHRQYICNIETFPSGTLIICSQWVIHQPLTLYCAGTVTYPTTGITTVTGSMFKQPRVNQLTNLYEKLWGQRAWTQHMNTTPYSFGLPMAERVGCGTPCLLWSLGVREVVGSRPGRGNIVRRVFHPTRKLVRFSLLKCPSIKFQILNSELRSPRGEV